MYRNLPSNLLRWNPVAPLGEFVTGSKVRNEFIIVIIGLPHMSTEDDIYRGYYIPAGTLIMGNSWYNFGPFYLVLTFISPRMISGRYFMIQRPSPSHCVSTQNDSSVNLMDNSSLRMILYPRPSVTDVGSVLDVSWRRPNYGYPSLVSFRSLISLQAGTKPETL
jgi:hypothetical protein